MPPPASIPTWLLVELTPTLRLASLLAGSPKGAAELVAETLASDVTWMTAVDEVDRATRVRAAVVRCFLDSPLGRARPAPTDGLEALTGRARAGVVLRDGERLTTGEIVTLLDRPARAVARELAATPPGSHDDEIAELGRIAPTPADAVAAFPRARRRTRRRRGRRRAVLLAAGFAAVVAIAVPTVVLPALPHQTRPPGQWRYSHEVALADGWRLNYRSITAQTETTGIELPWPAPPDRIRCTITVTVVGSDLPRSGPTTATAVGGRSGVLVDEPGNDLSLQWEYAAGAWAGVECPSAAATPALLRRIAGQVRFRDDRQPLPFMLSALPADYRIRMVGQVDESPDWGPFLVLDPPNDSYWPVLLIGPHTSEGASDDGVERCLGQGQTVCVTAAQSDDQVPVNRSVQRRILSRTVDLVRVAGDPADPATWFDAIELPG